MDNQAFTVAELKKKLADEPSESLALAVLFGRSLKDKGRIMTAYVNRQLAHLGYSKLKVADLKETLAYVTGDKLLYAVYQNSYLGIITLDDIMPQTEDFGKPLQEAHNYEITTPSVVDREAINASLRDFRKVQRKASAQQILSEQINKAIETRVGKFLEELPTRKAVTKPIHTLSRTAVVTPTDWHIGAIIDNIPENAYNYDLFKKRIDQYINQVIAYVEDFQCEDIKLVHLGDLIEGIDMRKVNQSFEAEFHASEQIALAMEAFIDIIDRLSEIGLPLTVGGVGGNHDRFTGNKADAIYGDNIMYIVISNLLMLQKRGLFRENVTIVDNLQDIYSLELEFQGQINKFVHGDGEKGTDRNRISKFVKEHPVDNMWFGHYHSNSHNQEDYSRMAYMGGSIMGANSYSKSINAPLTKASQLFTVIGRTDQGTVEKFAVPIFFNV